MESILELKNVSYWYEKDKTILDNLTVNFEKGKFYTVIGPSGSGKTTFLSLISGLDKKKNGEILYCGKNIDKIGLNNYRNKYVSIIFQGYNLLTYMTALQNVISAISIKGIKVKSQKERALEMLKKVGLTEEQCNQKVLTLSGGQQQRVAIARALVSETDVIIADEPTGNLDEKTSNEIIKIFKDIVEKENKCLIMVTHNIDITKNSDITYKLKNKTLLKEKMVEN
ncbi:ABC transporter [Clostridium baratii]|uniref:ABC transporter family protein n=2 Tax=Clostridium baratii TaxID=1561 RepID=A0A0A7FYS1_9CLOT|nr:ABC transporter ATP-binding protein [Clostridium baratii]AIY84742.1 ABC transporter family protein [Clostridium baratii str. Sullivan]KJU72568.1 ABC transporter [Clostridium baratii]MBS6005592.1 ABC transporter ATP-binding protein [Clostridium baratii]MBS6041747.1 ABC transporter ATP-binding protein [Clostridium baratii]MBT9831175.1 ATP-binding cassette domain-containing protein [Clostridium baratii]